MAESAAIQAFVIGITSACSLPLGAINSTFWSPQNQIISFLMAFGGGALLAALTIDLVGSALEQGHFTALAIGCSLGGFMFFGLNHILDRYGGFLRKSSTAANYLYSQRQQRLRRLLTHLGRLSIFENLPYREIQTIIDAATCREYEADTVLYRQRDPSEGLYIIEKGSVQLLDPQEEMQPTQKLSDNDAFGRMAFFTGAPHATVAMTTADTRVWVLPRQAFIENLKTSPALAQAVQRFLRSQETTTYLRERQGLERSQVERWEQQVVEHLQAEGSLKSAVPTDAKVEEFKQILNSVSRVPIFRQLSAEDAVALADKIFCKSHAKGHIFFNQRDRADRMYILAEGEVSLIDPQDRTRHPVTLHRQDAFGALSFVTGAPHTATAIATTDVTVWVLRKPDFDTLLQESSSFQRLVKEYLQHEEVALYLQHKQHFDERKARRWVQKAVRQMDEGKLIPSATDMAAAVKEHKGAPMAIWLGILLDGIPESLVIGSSLINAQVSLSLLAGLFLANYPEALSSSVQMKQQGLSNRYIAGLWISLMFVTGIGAAVGRVFLVEASPFLLALMKGIAAGSMLTMISQTMLPEAYLKGGSIVGLSTLFGFLVAIFFKTLE